MTYVVIAEFVVQAGQIEAFIEAIGIHSHNSRTLEPGCIHFDVNQDPADHSAFCLYEVYKDAAAYEAHRAMPSYAAFISAATPMLVKHDGSLFKTRKVLSRLFPA